MKQYKLAKDFLGFKKGDVLYWNTYCHQYELRLGKDSPYDIAFVKAVVESDSDIFEEVKSLRENVRAILDKFLNDYKYIVDQDRECEISRSEKVNALSANMEEHCNKILALLTKEDK